MHEDRGSPRARVYSSCAQLVSTRFGQSKTGSTLRSRTRALTAQKSRIGWLNRQARRRTPRARNSEFFAVWRLLALAVWGLSTPLSAFLDGNQLARGFTPKRALRAVHCVLAERWLEPAALVSDTDNKVSKRQDLAANLLVRVAKRRDRSPLTAAQATTHELGQAAPVCRRCPPIWCYLADRSARPRL